MRVDLRDVRPDVVITLTSDEAWALKRFVGLGLVDFKGDGLDRAAETADLRRDLYRALARKGV